jgi:hypothetical protein
MNDLVNLLQTLVLVLTLILVVFVLGWTVYAFRKFVILFNHLIDEIEKPRVCVHTEATATASPESRAVVAPVDAQEEPVELKRYPCHRCKAKLPEEPTHSVVKDEVNILVFKCRRCGKETEVDPLKTEPITENK